MTPPSKSRKRLVFWLTTKLTEEILALTETLIQAGFEVKSFLSLDDLIVGLELERPGILAVCDVGTQPEVLKLLDGVMAVPDLRGAKMVMVSFNLYETARAHAAGQCFRDIIVGSLAPGDFLARFRYATANRSTEMAEPSVSLKVSLPAKVLLPCRLTEINANQVFVESRLQPVPGESFLLTGELPLAMGLPGLKLTVQEVVHSELVHRFSAGFRATWEAPPVGSSQAARPLPPGQPAPHAPRGLAPFWQKMEARAQSPQTRIYVAIAQPSLRVKVLRALHQPIFLVNAALQRHSLKSEPRYFSPHILIVDDTLAFGQEGQALLDALEQVPPYCKVVIVGRERPDDRAPSAYRPQLFQTKPFAPFLAQICRERFVSTHTPELHHAEQPSAHRPLSELPHWILHQVITLMSHRNTPQSSQQSSLPTYGIAGSDPWSFASLLLPAQITQLHPRQIQLTCLQSLGEFSLLRLKSLEFSSLLKRAPILKIVRQSSHAQATLQPPSIHELDAQAPEQSQDHLIHEPWTYTAVFSDLSSKETEGMSQWLIAHLQNSIAWTENLERSTVNEQRLPETHHESLHETLPKSLAVTISPPPSEPQVNHAVERSIEVGRDALRGIKNTIDGHETHGWVQVAAPMIVVGMIMLGILWGLFTYLSRNFERSGSTYSEQIKNFSP